MLNRYAAIALATASMFFIVMSVLVSSPPLFYMVTAVVATLGASRLQAFLAVRGLRFERYVPPLVRVGEKVRVEITVWSERRIKRPLVSVVDGLPPRLVTEERVWSLPVAPSFDQPIRTHYEIRPMRRGRYAWGKLHVFGTDALGLVTVERTYNVDTAELTVYPAPIPVNIELNPAPGYGSSDLEVGAVRGSGLEPRGVREYQSGDPLRYIHWASSARTGKLQVKEFDTGSTATLAMVFQNTIGTEIGNNKTSTLEAMCGHALFFAQRYLASGAQITFPQVEGLRHAYPHPEVRKREVREILTDIAANSNETISQQIARLGKDILAGDTLTLFLTVQDPHLPSVISRYESGRVLALLYDANAYRDLKAPSVNSVTDPSYIIQLERAGARVTVMPIVESLI